MAAPILPNSSESDNGSVQACRRAKFAQNGAFLESLHDCTPQKLKFSPVSEFYLKIIVGDRLIFCPADEVYFCLLEALASGQEVSLDVLVSTFGS